MNTQIQADSACVERERARQHELKKKKVELTAQLFHATTPTAIDAIHPPWSKAYGLGKHLLLDLEIYITPRWHRDRMIRREVSTGVGRHFSLDMLNNMLAGWLLPHMIPSKPRRSPDLATVPPVRDSFTILRIYTMLPT
jgi:hypothetical protein